MKNLRLFHGLFWLLVAAALLAADWWLWQAAEATRQAIASRRAALIERPSQQLALNSLQSELDRRQADLQRLKQYLIARDQLDSFVGRLEAEAKRAQVTLIIPAVAERQSLDDQGQPVVPAGPIADAEFRLTATGSPKQLLQFLHSVEALPYLLYVESWSIKTDTAAATRRVPESATPVVPIPPPGKLEAIIVLAIARQPL